MMSESTTEAAPSVTASTDGTRVVSCELLFSVMEDAEVVLQLVASEGAGRVISERLDIRVDGQPVESVVALGGPHGARLQIVQSPPGRLTVSYRSEIDSGQRGAPRSADAESLPWETAYDRLTYQRPSRYCPSDHLVGFAVAEFGIGPPVPLQVRTITHWIQDRIGYVAGSSSVHDSAEDTLLTGMGTCRDFAHLGVALCRAVGIPARFAAVYAPGLSPMDFHAVFETLEEGRWCAHDATVLAPRQTMVRMSTGRDAADAAFASVNSGIATLEAIEVTATAGGHLPSDEPDLTVQLA
jgi:transglutaminase-like putative cysteine protease